MDRLTRRGVAYLSRIDLLIAEFFTWRLCHIRLRSLLCLLLHVLRALHGVGVCLLQPAIFSSLRLAEVHLGNLSLDTLALIDTNERTGGDIQSETTRRRIEHDREEDDHHPFHHLLLLLLFGRLCCRWWRGHVLLLNEEDHTHQDGDQVDRSDLGDVQVDFKRQRDEVILRAEVAQERPATHHLEDAKERRLLPQFKCEIQDGIQGDPNRHL